MDMVGLKYMGTNYYVKQKTDKNEDDRIKAIADDFILKLESLGFNNYECGLDRVRSSIMNLKEDISLHIGKNSFGWRFAFASDNFQGLQDFKKVFNPDTHIIEDEYKREVPLKLFCKIVRDTLQWNGDDQVLNNEGYRLLSGEFS
jgi:hypothetical protein